MTNQPTPEQIEALQAFADKYGRTWKRTLGDKWMNGRDADEPKGYLLRQVRNQLGPTWLFDKCKVKPVSYAELARREQLRAVPLPWNGEDDPLML